MFAAAVPAQGVALSLTDGLASASFDTDSGAITSWKLNGTEHVSTLRYYYRIGNSAELPLGPNDGAMVFNGADQDPGDPSFLTARYTLAGKFKVEYQYSILGAGTNVSKLDLNLRIDTDSTIDQNISIFAYNDFDLAASPFDNSVAITPSDKHNVADQFDGLTTVDDIIEAGNGGGDAAQGPTHWQAGTFPTIIGSLIDGSPTTLSDTDSANNGDLTYAFQYDFFLRNVNASPDVASQKIFTVLDSKLLNVPFEPGQAVPEPLTTTLGILGITALGLGATARRRGALQ